MQHQDSDENESTDSDNFGLSGPPTIVAETLKKGVTYTQNKKEAIYGTIP